MHIIRKLNQLSSQNILEFLLYSPFDSYFSFSFFPLPSPSLLVDSLDSFFNYVDVSFLSDYSMSLLFFSFFLHFLELQNSRPFPYRFLFYLNWQNLIFATRILFLSVNDRPEEQTEIFSEWFMDKSDERGE